MKVVVAVLLCLVEFGLAKDPDPCTTYTALTQKGRNSKYVSTITETPICDNLLKKDWYRFSGEAGEGMAEGKVDMKKCGTSSPIYLAAAHPSAGDYTMKEIKVCGNFGLTPQGCTWSETVKVKRCASKAAGGDDFFVYELKAPPACDMAYCGYSKQHLTCPAGKALDETKKICIEITPSIEAPTMGIPEVTGDDFYIPCNFNVEIPADKTKGMADVFFLFNGKIGFTAPGVSLKENYAKLPGSELKGKLPSKVSCAVVGYWSHYAKSNYHRTPTMLSTNSFPAGIQVFDERGAEVKGEIIFGESHSEPQKLRIVSTIPITKKTHSLPFETKEPKIEFGLYTRIDQTDVAKVLKLGDQRCQAQIKSSDWDKTKGQASGSHDLKFVAYQDKEKGSKFKDTELHLELQVTLSMQAKTSIWTGFKVPAIKVRVKQSSPAQCTSNPDPHFTSFDGRRFDVHDIGEFKLAEVPGLFTATTRHQPCKGNPRPACNCALSIRELDEVIMIDACGKRRPQIIYRNAADPDAVSPTRLSIWGDNTGKVFEIFGNSGVKAKATFNELYGFFINIFAPEGFRNELVGLCGNMNGDPNDDFDGKTLEKFYKELKVTKPEESPFRVRKALKKMENPKVPQQENYCFCYQNVVRCFQTPSKDPTHPIVQREILPMLAPAALSRNGRKRREATKLPYTDDVEVYTDTFDLNPPERDLGPIKFPTPSGITEAQAREQCRGALRNSSISSKCSKLPTFDVMMTLDDCLFDIKITDSLSVAAVSTGAMEDACENEASMIAPEDKAKLNFKPEEIVQEKCPQSCSLQGACNKGVCTCHVGYLGADCSINSNAVPEVEEFLDAGACDVAERPCRKTRLGVTNVYDTPSLTCRHRIFTVDPLTGAETENRSGVVTGNMTSFGVVSCPLPPLEGRAMVLMTSVSTNTRDFSKPQRYVVYDSICVDCNSGKCFVERDMCAIESKCYDAGDINPTKPSEVCTPAASRVAWSIVPTTTVKQTQPPTPKCSFQPISNNVSPIRAVSLATGDVATADSWPWHAQIMAGGKHACSGVLVDQQWILTSEACVAKSKGSYLTVRLGGMTLDITNPVNNGEGLSLLRLSTKAAVPAVCLAKTSGEFEAATSDECYTTGFITAAESCYDSSTAGGSYRGSASTTETNNHCFNWASSALYKVRPQQYRSQGVDFHNHCRNPMSNNKRFGQKPWCYVDTQGTRENCKVTTCDPALTGMLQQTRVEVKDTTRCNEFYGGTLTANQNCAGFSGSDVFQGETGGPLVCRRSPSSPFRLLGVRSPITADWNDVTTPAFHNVGASLAWIRRTTGA